MASSVGAGLKNESNTRCPATPEESLRVSASRTVFIVKLAFVEDIDKSVPSGRVNTKALVIPACEGFIIAEYAAASPD